MTYTFSSVNIPNNSIAVCGKNKGAFSYTVANPLKLFLNGVSLAYNPYN